MDVVLYAISLVLFGVLYLAIGIFLAYTLLFCLLIMLVFLILRHGKLPDNYPFSAREVAQTTIFIGVTWAIFVFLGPKDPLPFVGTGLFYHSLLPAEANVLIAIAILVSVIFLGIFSFWQSGEGRGISGGSSGGDDKPKQGVGA
jgi:hypothetical protein